jgi:hypothetical protein
MIDSGSDREEADREVLILQIIARLAHRSGGSNASRVTKVRAATAVLTIEELARAYFAECADEKTGRRFGEAKCRFGRCAKIGHTTHSYQLWLVWA